MLMVVGKKESSRCCMDLGSPGYEAALRTPHTDALRAREEWLEWEEVVVQHILSDLSAHVRRLDAASSLLVPASECGQCELNERCGSSQGEGEVRLGKTSGR